MTDELNLKTVKNTVKKAMTKMPKKVKKTKGKTKKRTKKIIRKKVVKKVVKEAEVSVELTADPLPADPLPEEQPDELTLLNQQAVKKVAEMIAALDEEEITDDVIEALDDEDIITDDVIEALDIIDPPVCLIEDSDEDTASVSSIITESSLPENWDDGLFNEKLQLKKGSTPAVDEYSLYPERMTGEGTSGKKKDVKHKVEKNYKDIITNLCGHSYNAHTFIQEKIKMMKRNPTHKRNVRKYLKAQGHYNSVPKLGEYYEGFITRTLDCFNACDMTGETAKQAKSTITCLPLGKKGTIEDVDERMYDEEQFDLKPDFNKFITGYKELLKEFLKTRYNKMMPYYVEAMLPYDKKSKKKKVKKPTALEEAKKELETINEAIDELEDKIDDCDSDDEEVFDELMSELKAGKKIIRKKIKVLMNV